MRVRIFVCALFIFFLFVGMDHFAGRHVEQLQGQVDELQGQVLELQTDMEDVYAVQGWHTGRLDDLGRWRQ